MIRLQVRDYRGVERADVDLAPIALVSGTNEAGKSSLAQAARAALAGVAIPIPGVAKKDARLLVRDGADSGSATAGDGTGQTKVTWPKADVITGDDAPWCSHYAVGLRHLFDLDDKERANVLAGYINSIPDVTDLAAALEDAGYGQKAVDKMWQAVNGDGWDATYKKAREHSTKLKGGWEEVTGEKYGSKKAVGWLPAGWDPSLAKMTRETIESVVQERNVTLEKLIGLQAVSKVDVDRMVEHASTIVDLEKQEAELGKAKEDIGAKVKVLRAQGRPFIPQPAMACPCCQAALEVDGKRLVAAGENSSPDKIKAAEEKAKLFDEELEAGEAEFKKAYDAHNTCYRELVEARRSQTELQTLREKGQGKAGEAVDDEKVEEARAALATARAALMAFDAKTRADTLHGQLERNEKLVAILAPDGLRRRKLAAGLDDMNKRLAELCASAKWPVVRIDETLQGHYGTRPVWAASASGQWRARAVVQLCMAMMDGSAAVVIDESDILDFKGRNGLLMMLKKAGVPALLCMTVNKPALVPDLAEAGIGCSYWIESGVASSLAATEGKAA